MNPSIRMPWTTLEKLLMAVLVIFALALIYMQAAIFQSFMPPVGIMQLVPTLIIIGVFALRWRWAPLLTSILMVVDILLSLGPIMYDLSHPAANVQDFIWTLVVLPIMFVGIVAGIAITVRQRRATER